jgi:hypothetical protein
MELNFNKSNGKEECALCTLGQIWLGQIKNRGALLMVAGQQAKAAMEGTG